MKPRRKRLVVICPVYNEERNITYFFERIRMVFARLDPAEYEYRLLFTNNRSADGTLARLRELRAAYHWVDYLTLSRNHGYQLSVLAGLSAAKADLYMVCDVDCEDPPELLFDFLAEIRRGADIAYGIRNNRPDPWLLGRFRSLFYFLLRSLGDYRIIPYMAEFALFRRCVRDTLVAGRNTFPFLRAEVGYAGFTLAGVDYRRESRRHGRTHYNFWGNFRFAVAGILSSTTFPLRATFYALPGVILLSLSLCLLFAAGAVGFQATVVSLLGLNALYVAAAVGFLAIYLARTYQNGLGRKRFIVDRSQSALSQRGARRNRAA
jgi:glycosyltransferase involved in cell wall biosynthesis